MHKVTIHPGFLTTYPGKSRSSPGTPICPVFGLVSRICPDLPISAAVCLRFGGQKLAEILSVCTKKSRAAGAPLGPLRGSSRHSPRPKSDPPTAHAVALSPYDSRLQCTLSVWCKWVLFLLQCHCNACMFSNNMAALNWSLFIIFED